jgi:hypothetical protein
MATMVRLGVISNNVLLMMIRSVSYGELVKVCS